MDFSFFVNNWLFFVFLLFLLVFVVWKKKNMSLSGNFPYFYILMYRTKLGLDKMKKWSQKHPRLFLYLAYYSFFIGVVGMVFGFGYMFYQLDYIVEHQITGAGGLVLPVKTEAGVEGAVPVFYVPFFYWIISLFVLMFVHEFAHGVIAERFNVPIKSSGFAFFGSLSLIFGFTIFVLFVGKYSFFSWDFWMVLVTGLVLSFLPILPGAFVEPDEKVLKKVSAWKKIAVFGAGSASNLFFGLLFLGVLVFGAGPLVNSTMELEKVGFTGVMNESSLINYNVSSGYLVGIENYSMSNVISKLSNLSPNENLVLSLEVGGKVSKYNVTTFASSENSTKGMLGITGLKYEFGNKKGYEWLGDFPVIFTDIFKWLFFLNIGIGLMNLLPLWITDGGQILRELLLLKFKKKVAFRILNFVCFITMILIILTLWPKVLF